MDRQEHIKVHETPRLTLRPFDIADAESFYRNFTGEEENLQFFTDIRYDLERTKALITDWSDARGGEEHWRWAATLKGGQDVIGIVSLRLVDPSDRIGELSFGIGNTFWGRGLGSELVQAVLDICASERNFAEVIAAFDKENFRAIRTARRCGMRYRGEMVESRSKDSVCFVVYTLCFPED